MVDTRRGPDEIASDVARLAPLFLRQAGGHVLTLLDPAGIVLSYNEEGERAECWLCVMCSDGRIRGPSNNSPVLNHGTVPSCQKPSLLRAGVPPFTTFEHNPPTESILHPLGINPCSDSSSSLGKSAAVAGSMPSGSRPSALARTGSKSTNQDLNSACAMASRVVLVWRRRSMRSSNPPKKTRNLLLLGGFRSEN